MELTSSPTLTGMTPVRRSVARALVLDPEDRVLLLAGGDPARRDVTVWHAPGGALEAGESAVEAAGRELAEETGADLAVGPVVWTRRAAFSFDGVAYEQNEVYLLVHAPAAYDVVPRALTALEARYLAGGRWWSVADLRSYGFGGADLLAPPDLADRLEALLRDGVPAEPVEVAGAVLP